MDELRSMCCLLCLQGEGGLKAEAVATVMAAVDLARVRQPVHVEASGHEEEPVDLRREACVPPPSEQRQVGPLPVFSSSLPSRAPTLSNLFAVHSVGHSRSKELQNPPARWRLVLPPPQFHISQFLKLLFLNMTLAMR